MFVAAKIKATLIHKAKLKKSYHKDLVEAGYGDEGTGSNGGALGVRKGKFVKPILGDQRRGPEAEEEEEEEEVGGGSESEEEGKGRAKRVVRGSESESESEDEDEDEGRKGRGGGKGRVGAAVGRSQPPKRDSLPETLTNSSSNKRPRPITAVGGKVDGGVKKPRLSEAEVEKLRKDKREERKEWGQRGRGGQPKLGGRVDMLLARIKKGMES